MLSDNWIFPFVLGVLAVYRFAHAIAIETGPKAIFFETREWFIRRWGFTSWQSEFIHCPLCMGFWLSLICTLVIFWGQAGPGQMILIWFGMAGCMCVVHLALYNSK